MHIIAFGASNSSKSINKQFANYTANQFDNTSIKLLDLNEYELPLYSVDLETESGIPQRAIAFYQELQKADLIVISLAEHNGSYSAAFKNLFDWMSRYQVKNFENKKMFLVSTTPGGRGGRGVMDAALVRFPIHGANVLAHFCLPFFQQNFDAEKGIVNEELREQFNMVVAEVKSKL